MSDTQDAIGRLFASCRCCPHCNGDGQIVALDPDYVHPPGAVKKKAILPCPTCRGEKTVTAEQHAQWQEAHGDLRDRVLELERQVATLMEWLTPHGPTIEYNPLTCNHPVIEELEDRITRLEDKFE